MSTFRVLAKEITELSRQSAEEEEGPTRLAALEEENQLLHAVIDNFPGGLQLIDRNLKLVFFNETLMTMLDYPKSLFAFGTPSLEQLFRFNAQRGEYGPGPVEEHVTKRMDLVRQRRAHTYQRTRPNGATLEIRGVPLAGGGFMTMYIDVTDQRPRAASGEALSDLDLLTGLPKLGHMRSRLEEHLAQLRSGQIAAVHCMDLDQFRAINTRFGRVGGDQILKEIGSRLRGLLRGADPVARIGGDRFMVLQREVKRPSDVARLANRILLEIARPIELGSEKVEVSSSIGFALLPRDGHDADTLMDKAQSAVIATKQRSPGGFDAAAVHWSTS